MPLTLTLTEGVLSQDAIKQAIAELTASFLEHHGLSGNKVMTPNVTAHVNILPKGLTFSGGKEVAGAWIETKTPSFALSDNKVQASFFRAATQILQNLSDGNLPKEHIWANGVHAVDGTWNINGQPMTNQEIAAALKAG